MEKCLKFLCSLLNQLSEMLPQICMHVFFKVILRIMGVIHPKLRPFKSSYYQWERFRQLFHFSIEIGILVWMFGVIYYFGCFMVSWPIQIQLKQLQNHNTTCIKNSQVGQIQGSFIINGSVLQSVEEERHFFFFADFHSHYRSTDPYFLFSLQIEF